MYGRDVKTRKGVQEIKLLLLSQWRRSDLLNFWLPHKGCYVKHVRTHEYSDIKISEIKNQKRNVNKASSITKQSINYAVKYIQDKGNIIKQFRPTNSAMRNLNLVYECRVRVYIFWCNRIHQRGADWWQYAGQGLPSTGGSCSFAVPHKCRRGYVYYILSWVIVRLQYWYVASVRILDIHMCKRLSQSQAHPADLHCQRWRLANDSRNSEHPALYFYTTSLVSNTWQ